MICRDGGGLRRDAKSSPSLLGEGDRAEGVLEGLATPLTSVAGPLDSRPSTMLRMSLPGKTRGGF